MKKIFAYVLMAALFASCGKDKNNETESPVLYTVTVSSDDPTMGSVSTAGGQYEYGSTFTAVAWAEDGFQFVSWESTGSVELSSQEVETTVTVKGDGTLTAKFEAVLYSVAVSPADPDMGSVSSAGGSYASGASFAVTATANPGYSFVGWVTTGNIEVSTAVAATTTVRVNGSGMVTAEFEAALAPYILYWDGSTMQVDRWGVEVDQENMLFFQFGSVVGFTMGGSIDTWSVDDVKFNPTGTTYPATEDGYMSIPNWINYPYNSSTEEGYISSPSYHTLTNVSAGRGDPCRLVGLTVGDIAAGVYDSGRYRMPTRVENVDFTATPTENYAAGAAGYHFYGAYALACWGLAPEGTRGEGAWFPIPGDREAKEGRTTINTDPAGFLPAAGCRGNVVGGSPKGGPSGTGIRGYYWSSTPISTDCGYYLDFYKTSSSIMSPTNWAAAGYGYAVRCVPQ